VSFVGPFRSSPALSFSLVSVSLCSGILSVKEYDWNGGGVSRAFLLRTRERGREVVMLCLVGVDYRMSSNAFGRIIGFRRIGLVPLIASI